MMHRTFSVGDRSGLQAGRVIQHVKPHTQYLQSLAVVGHAIEAGHCPFYISTDFPEKDIVLIERYVSRKLKHIMVHLHV